MRLYKCVFNPELHGCSTSSLYCDFNVLIGGCISDRYCQYKDIKRSKEIYKGVVIYIVGNNRYIYSIPFFNIEHSELIYKILNDKNEALLNIRHKNKSVQKISRLKLDDLVIKENDNEYLIKIEIYGFSLFLND